MAGDGVGKSERSARTKQKLLEAGLHLISRGASTENIFQTLEINRVCAEAGVSSGALHYQFGNRDGYFNELLHYALTQRPNPPFAAGRAAFESALAAGDDIAIALLAGAGAALTSRDDDPTFALQMAVFSTLPGDRHAARELEQTYRLVVNETSEYYQQILDLSGRRVRPPFTVEFIATLFIAALEGLSLRRGVNPAAAPPESLGYVLAALMAMATETIEDDSTAEDWMRGFSTAWLQP